ncbi:6,7-dimethyl-8-ribityllumazine synthase [Candidatus Uhrbacteria bacterium]|nr:6,7-dimethyl-8-ribityllumazine synthase [Candidatus Uhrbacteria bacterium]
MRHNVFSEQLSAKGFRFAIVVARFNREITDGLLRGATEALMDHGASVNKIDTFWVPGSFEIPLAAQTAARTKRYHAIICLGAVIRGETPHFDYVCAAAQQGVLRVALDARLPVTFGVITTNNLKQAQARSGDNEANSGRGAVLVALEMVSTLGEIRDKKMRR